VEQLQLVLGDKEGRVVLKAGMRGFSLIEMMIGLALLGILLSMAAPSFGLFLRNTQIKNAAETTLAGITLARAEAVRRNTSVRFSFVSDLTNSCVLSTASTTWVVSLADPTSYCAVEPADQADAAPATAGDPKIVQKKAGDEGTGGSVLLTTTGGVSVVFNGLGRVTGGGMTTLDFASAGGTCEHLGGSMRCLRILVTTGGQSKLCDPKVTAATDPRFCS
jgi:type IV fimbrial biogenesis protein FimT